MSRMWQEALPTAPSDLGRRIGVCLHWAFLRHVLPRSKFLDSAQSFMGTHGLKAYAENFVDQLLPILPKKEVAVRLFFEHFTQLPRDRAALEYLNSITGQRQLPI